MDNFDRDFNRMWKGALIYATFVTMLFLGGISFLAWVIIKVIEHLGIV